MKLNRLWPLLRIGFIGMGATTAVVIIVSHTSQSFDREAQHKASIEQARAYFRAGVGTEVSFAGAAARTDVVRASLDSMAEFIRYRSGLELSDEVKGRLI